MIAFFDAPTDGRAAFYDALRPSLGALTEANVDGFERVLDEAARRGTRHNDLAYILATAWWESGKTMQPVREAYWLSEDWRRRNLRYHPFYGRGLVQLTWKENYRKASGVVGADLVADPDKALDPDVSVRLLFDGMARGWFTGRKVSDYIDDLDESDAEDLREFKAARRVVNGQDRAEEIGRLALMFEAALKHAGYGIPSEAPTETKPVSPTPTPVESRSLLQRLLAFLVGLFRRHL